MTIPTSALNAAAEAIQKSIKTASIWGLASNAVEAALPHLQRVITSVEEVETLFESDANVVLMDEDGLVLQNLAGGWGSPSFDYTTPFVTSRDLHRMFGPNFVVLAKIEA